ncbi:MAG: YggS family pyridoxal phosphate-dependent enzyme [Alphaproteobacteria bacterium]|nr:YggS family pyridoxal phosphate-dependent enzyme [Alphaproteobacteria bacterium]
MSQALADIRARIASAARAGGRSPDEVTLIAVSKTFGADTIEPVIAAGQRVFGENRVQEAQGKWPALQAATPGIALHLIGQLQSNKAREAVALFDAIHSVDRLSLAKALAAETARQNRSPLLFLQVNTGEEPQKGGVAPKEAAGFLAECRSLGLDPQGLMCIPPEDEEPALHFALLAELAHRLGLSKLSMGMSADFETAVKLGATHIRVGSAILGSRV